MAKSLSYPKQDRVANWLDNLLILLFVASVFAGFSYLAGRYLEPKSNIFAFDWKLLYDIAVGTGAVAAVSRGGYALWNKMKVDEVDERYRKAIMRVLIEAAEPLTEEEIKKRTRQKVSNPRVVNRLPILLKRKSLKERQDEIFEQKFSSAWFAVLEQHKATRQVVDGRVLFSYNQSENKKDEKDKKET